MAWMPLIDGWMFCLAVFVELIARAPEEGTF